MINHSQIMNKSLDVNLQGHDPQDLKRTNRLSTVQDPDTGLWYLAVVPMGHVAYNELTDSYKVEQKKKSVLIKEHTLNYLVSASMTRYIGNDVNQYSTSTVAPIDYSEYDKKMIVIKNNHDAPILLSVMAYKSPEAFAAADGTTKAIDILNSADIKIEAGKTLVVDPTTVPKIENPYVGIALRVYRSTPAPTTGDINVQFYGR